MYLVTFQLKTAPAETARPSSGGARLGICERPGGPILDVEEAARGGADGAAEAAVPRSVLELLDAGDEAWSALLRLYERSLGRPEVWRQEAEVRLLAPIPRPRKNIYAIGLNYKAHNEEFTGAAALPEFPIVFTKGAGSVIGPGEAIESHPDVTREVDYEVELAVVIGKRGRNIPPERAEEFIFGYTIINDVTARDLQRRTSQWFLAKSLDTFCPMGPYLAHKSVVGWPVELDIASYVNGEVRQSSNTRSMIFDIPTLIATLSRGMTLEPGDIIATGTCQGVGMGFNPPRFLRPGDVVEMSIEKLGTLRNPVV